MTEQPTVLDAIVLLLVSIVVTVWARRILPRLTRYEHVGYVHEDTARAVGWRGVPVHTHRKPPEENHVALYKVST